MNSYKYAIIVLTNDKEPFKKNSTGKYMAVELGDKSPKFVFKQWLEIVKRELFK